MASLRRYVGWMVTIGLLVGCGESAPPPRQQVAAKQAPGVAPPAAAPAPATPVRFQLTKGVAERTNPFGVRFVIDYRIESGQTMDGQYAAVIRTGKGETYEANLTGPGLAAQGTLRLEGMQGLRGDTGPFEIHLESGAMRGGPRGPYGPQGPARTVVSNTLKVEGGEHLAGNGLPGQNLEEMMPGRPPIGRPRMPPGALPGVPPGGLPGMPPGMAAGRPGFPPGGMPGIPPGGNANAANANSPPPPLPTPKLAEPLTPKQILADLKSNDRIKQRLAADQLAKGKPAEHVEEITRALEDLLTGSQKDNLVCRSAVKALGQCADKGAVPVLLNLVDDSDLFLRHEVIAELGRLKDPNAATALASRVEQLSDRANASKSLVAIGPAAEQAVHPLLENKDLHVRVEACRILGQIGTRASVPALQAAAKDRNLLLARTAKEAIVAAQRR